MALKVVWTPQAEKGLDKVLEYLEEEWTEREIQKLEENIKDFLRRIVLFPELYPTSTKLRKVHKGLVDKNNYMVYRVHQEKDLIEIINFRGTKQKPLE